MTAPPVCDRPRPPVAAGSAPQSPTHRCPRPAPVTSAPGDSVMTSRRSGGLMSTNGRNSAIIPPRAPTALEMCRYRGIRAEAWSPHTRSWNLPDASRSRSVPAIAIGGYDGLTEHVDKTPCVHQQLLGAQRGAAARHYDQSESARFPGPDARSLPRLEGDRGRRPGTATTAPVHRCDGGDSDVPDGHGSGLTVSWAAKATAPGPSGPGSGGGAAVAPSPNGPTRSATDGS